MKVRHLMLLASSLVALVILLQVMKGRAVLVPTAVGGGVAAIAWATFLPLLWSAALCVVFEEVGAEIEWRPCPRLGWSDACLFVLANIALVVALRAASTPEVLLKVVAHALIVAGLATVVTVLRDAPSGILGATTLMLVTSTYSLHLAGAAYVRILQPEGDTAFALVVGLGLGATAVWLLFAGPRMTAQR